MDEVGLGKLLQGARKKAGLTQQELCQKAGLSYSTLAKIERGAIKAPSIFTIQSIAGALNTNLNDLMGDFEAFVRGAQRGTPRIYPNWQERTGNVRIRTHRHRH